MKRNKEARKILRKLIYKHDESLAKYCRRTGYNYGSLNAALSNNSDRFTYRLERLYKYIEDYGVKIEIKFNHEEGKH